MPTGPDQDIASAQTVTVDDGGYLLAVTADLTEPRRLPMEELADLAALASSALQPSATGDIVTHNADEFALATEVDAIAIMLQAILAGGD